MRATQYSTNKYGEMTAYGLRPSVYMRGAVRACARRECANSGFLGLGVAITGSSCYNLWQMEREERRVFLQSIYGKDGLGLSVGRLTVGASDYSAELYSYDDVAGDTSLEHFSIARDEEYIIPVIKEIIEINPEIRLFSSPWSPPGWMKTGGSMCGGYMRAEYIECYADYYVKFLKAYADHGIKIFALTPQNETETDQGGKMPACIWHPDIEARFISVLRRKLDEAGLDTLIWMYDHNFSGKDRVDWCLDTYPQLSRECGGIAFHYYDGAIEDTVFLKAKYPTLQFHFTEGGPRLYDNYSTDWCKWGTMICKVLNCGYSSFTGWNLMLDETGGPNVGPFFCGGLVTRHRDGSGLDFSGQYKAFRHFGRVAHSGACSYAVEFGKSNDSMFVYPSFPRPLVGTFTEQADGTASLVLVNPNGEKAQVQFEYGGELWYIELLPDTLATVVFE